MRDGLGFYGWEREDCVLCLYLTILHVGTVACIYGLVVKELECENFFFSFFWSMFFFSLKFKYDDLFTLNHFYNNVIKIIPMFYFLTKYFLYYGPNKLLGG